MLPLEALWENPLQLPASGGCQLSLGLHHSTLPLSSENSFVLCFLLICLPYGPLSLDLVPT